MDPRVCFISASALVHDYTDVPADVLDRAIFFFGSKRSWIFPNNDQERKDSLRQPTKYLEFPEDFKALVLKKESQGLLYFLKPDCNFKLVSDFFERIPGENYKPFILQKNFWVEEFDEGKKSRFHTTGQRVWRNLTEGEHDYTPVKEVIWQSNSDIIPVLSWVEMKFWK